MPRGALADKLVLYPVFKAEFIEGMYPFRSVEISKFHTVIGLYHLWSVSEIDFGSLNKVCCRKVALFLVRENKKKKQFYETAL